MAWENRCYCIEMLTVNKQCKNITRFGATCPDAIGHLKRRWIFFSECLRKGLEGLRVPARAAWMLENATLTNALWDITWVTERANCSDDLLKSIRTFDVMTVNCFLTWCNCEGPTTLPQKWDVSMLMSQKGFGRVAAWTLEHTTLPNALWNITWVTEKNKLLRLSEVLIVNCFPTCCNCDVPITLPQKWEVSTWPWP